MRHCDCGIDFDWRRKKSELQASLVHPSRYDGRQNASVRGLNCGFSDEGRDKGRSGRIGMCHFLLEGGDLCGQQWREGDNSPRVAVSLTGTVRRRVCLMAGRTLSYKSPIHSSRPFSSHLHSLPLLLLSSDTYPPIFLTTDTLSCLPWTTPSTFVFSPF